MIVMCFLGKMNNAPKTLKHSLKQDKEFFELTVNNLFRAVELLFDGLQQI